jgi:hypothetical protein
VDPLLSIPPEPQALVFEDSIVLIRAPRELARKKNAFTAAGGAALQVFTDFERVLTTTRAQDGARSLGTAELLETSPALLPASVQALKQLAAEFETVDMDDSGFEEYVRRCQQIIAAQAGLHMASVGPATRDMLAGGRLVLRDGGLLALQPLTSKGVPVYLFSSGYGDIVTQCLLQLGCVDAQHPTMVPQNIRIIRFVSFLAPASRSF